MISVTGIPSEQFEKYYPRLKWAFDSFSKRAIDPTTPEELAGQVKARRSQCWVALDDDIKACALTQVSDGGERTVTITHCAGRDREDWQEQLVETIRDWAESIGATTFITINRPGWTPFLRGMGLRETHRVMEQRIGQKAKNYCYNEPVGRRDSVAQHSYGRKQQPVSVRRVSD